jgi:mannose-1-phosphate guanylyltransferase
MTARQEVWAVVLAAGDGLRLAELTTNALGECVPKQYCSLDGRESLLDSALKRAHEIAPCERVCVIVAESHRRFWRESLHPLPDGNVIVQPSNRGTANGVVLSVLSILRRDPQACIVFLPADHHVCDEPKLVLAMREAIRTCASDAKTVALVGIEPNEPDPALGYIVPGRTLPDGSRTVEEFVEKPDLSRARELIAAGALWNSLILSVKGPALLEKVRASMGWIVDEMTAALARDAHVAGGPAALTKLYEVLPCTDFSRTILEGSVGCLRVVTAPHCGWCDLGTPKRVAELLERLQKQTLPLRAGDSAPAGFRPVTPSSIPLLSLPNGGLEAQEFARERIVSRPPRFFVSRSLSDGRGDCKRSNADIGWRQARCRRGSRLCPGARRAWCNHCCG